MVDGDGTVLAPNLGWDMVPLQKQLEQELGLPVTIDNEANAGAQGERFGAGGTPAIFYISAGSGIGSGIIINGELYKGPADTLARGPYVHRSRWTGMHLRQPRLLGAVCLGEILRQQGCRSPVQADIRADSPCSAWP